MKSKKLSPAMLDMLLNASRGLSLIHGLEGRSAHGGATWTMAALRRRGLINSMGDITEAGKLDLEIAEKMGRAG